MIVITIGIVAEDETGIEIGNGTGNGIATGTEIETVIVIASEMRRTMVVTGKERVGSGIAVTEIGAGGGATQGAEVEVGSERTVMATTVRGMHGALAQEDVETRKMVFARSPRKRKKRRRRKMMERTTLIQKLLKQTGFVHLLD